MQIKLKKIKKETRDVASLIFEKPKDFKFYPGQFLDVSIILSISSSPSEDFIQLTYKKGVSPVKKMLQALKSSDVIESSHPAGTVVIDDSSPLVFIAGGIGIAPHRSMIKWAVDKKLSLPITLIYSNSDSDFLFKKELDEWVKVYPNLKIHYNITSTDGRLTKEKIHSLLPTINSGPEGGESLIYYLAGPPTMVDDFENILLNLGIDETSIRTDRFDGL